MLRISDIKAYPHNITLRQPLKWGRADELRQLEHVLIRAELSDGTAGIAEATPRPSIYGETQQSVISIVEEYLAPLLSGGSVESFRSVAALNARMGQIKANNSAKGAVDMALHQALCRARGISLAEYLGCRRERIRISYIVSTGTEAEVMADVAEAFANGVRVFKVKIGKDLSQERETIRLLISQFPSAEFYVDANQTLEETTAAEVLEDLLELGVIHCEEALPIQRIEARRQLRRRCRMPIIADDSAFSPEDLERELAYETFDILNIKTARTGYSASTAMLEMCAGAGKGVMIGSQASSLLGCLYAATFAAREEVTCANECSFFLKTEADLSLAPPISDGWMRLSDVQNSIEGLTKRLDDFA